MFIKFTKSLMFKPVVLLMAIAMLTMSFTVPGNTVVLKAGTVVPMELINTVNSKNARTGEMVKFRVTDNVVVDGKTIIEIGAVANGQIVRAKKSGLLGSEGDLFIAVKSVQAVDGTTIYLTNGDLMDEGSNKVALSVVLTCLCLLGFLIKGGNAEIPAGSQVQAMVMSNTTLSVD